MSARYVCIACLKVEIVFAKLAVAAAATAKQHVFGPQHVSSNSNNSICLDSNVAASTAATDLFGCS